MTRPMRFGTGTGMVADRDSLAAAARRVEDLGYSTVAMSDHLFIPFAPLIALQAIADATSSIRLGQLVLAQGFRHPAVLAKELATIDVLSGGRLEVGIGAGWANEEFEQIGMPFEKASVRIEQLEETMIVLKGLFDDGPFSFAGDHFTITDLDGTPTPVQRPRPPIMVGGGGAKVLAAAARQADIIQVLPAPNRSAKSADPWRITARAYLEKIDWIRDAAGARFDDIELGTILQEVTITDDREQAEDAFLARYAPETGTPDAANPSRQEILDSPVVAIGSLDEVCDKLLATRATFGMNYFWAPFGKGPAAMTPILERLAGS